MSLADNVSVRNALRFAERHHRGETRKGTEDSPYILHPVAVAILLASVGAPTILLVAGILHDVVEDTDASIEEVRREFGDAVSSIVEELTKPGGKLPTPETAAQLKTIEGNAGKAADLLINLGDFVDDADAKGADHVASYFRDPVAKLDSYLELARILLERLEGSVPAYALALAAQLEELVPRVFALRADLLARQT